VAEVNNGILLEIMSFKFILMFCHQEKCQMEKGRTRKENIESAFPPMVWVVKALVFGYFLC
jgi:hypothetical protein